jgi:hypothetical protein
MSRYWYSINMGGIRDCVANINADNEEQAERRLRALVKVLGGGDIVGELHPLSDEGYDYDGGEDKEDRAGDRAHEGLTEWFDQEVSRMVRGEQSGYVIVEVWTADEVDKDILDALTTP